MPDDAAVISVPVDTPALEVPPEVLEKLPQRDYNEVRDQQEYERKHPEPDEDADGTDPQRTKRGTSNKLQKRFDKLTRRAREAESRAQAAERRAAEIEARINGSTPEPRTQTESAPSPTNSEDDFAKRIAFEKEQAEANHRHETAAKDHPDRMALARAKYPDFDETLKAQHPVPAIVIPFLKELPNGPETAYYLGKHPEVAKQLMETTNPVEVLRKVERISGAVEYAPVMTPPREKPGPPAPISTVGGSSARSGIPLDEMPIKDFIRARNKEERERRRLG